MKNILICIFLLLPVCIFSQNIVVNGEKVTEEKAKEIVTDTIDNEKNKVESKVNNTVDKINQNPYVNIDLDKKSVYPKRTPRDMREIGDKNGRTKATVQKSDYGNNFKKSNNPRYSVREKSNRESSKVNRRSTKSMNNYSRSNVNRRSAKSMRSSINRRK